MLVRLLIVQGEYRIKCTLYFTEPLRNCSIAKIFSLLKHYDQDSNERLKNRLCAIPRGNADLHLDPIV